jgi:hypothetical protein
MKGRHLIGIAVVFLAGVVLVACSSNPTEQSAAPAAAPAPVKKDPIPYTGKACLSQIANVATRWQADALPFHLESSVNEEDNGQHGTATIWKGMFASPSRRMYKNFTCSGSRLKESPSIGVTSSVELASGGNVAGQMFQQFALVEDSDKAYDAALEKGGNDLLKKDPKQPVTYVLDWNAKARSLEWIVLFGTTKADSKGFAVIDASTGKFLRAGK